MKQIAAAQALGERWVETSPEIIKLLQPNGLGKLNGKVIRHFCYHGILVCEHGQSESIENEMSERLNEKFHGKEAKVLGTI